MTVAVARPFGLPRLATLGPLVLALTGVLALSAHTQVPFWPVPMTLQPFAVLVIAGLAGPRIAVAAFAAYLVEGALGLPVFAGTPAHGIGPTYIAGPTGGYLAGMLAASALVGRLVRRAAGRPAGVAGAMAVGVVVIYTAGAAWLATFVGVPKALTLGVVPFLAGDAVKAALATALVLAAGRVRRA
jgi:biotin transport system substrate-specific component